MQLRDYQEESIAAIFHYFQNNKGNPIVALPTGTGKSPTMGGFIKRIFSYWPNQRILIVTHSKKLIEQNFNTLKRMWPQAPAGIYSSGLGHRDTRQPIIFCGIASVYERAIEFGHTDLILVDEAHMISPKEGTMYTTFLNGNMDPKTRVHTAGLADINPHLKVIGFTATSWRLGNGSLTESGIFTDTCIDYTIREKFNYLLAQGWMTRLIPRRTNFDIDVTGVRKKGDDFIEADLQKASDKEAVTRRAIEETLTICGNRSKWLAFTTGITHAEHVTYLLDEVYGVPAKMVHSKMKDKLIEDIITAHENGEFTALVNVNMLTTGYDSPYIDLILGLRPSASSQLWVQMLGRGTRTVYHPSVDQNNSTAEQRLWAIANGPKPNCLVADFGGNTRRLGPINDPVIPSKKVKKGGQGAPVKCCDNCNTFTHASVRFCENCGFEFRFQVKIKDRASTDEIISEDAPEIGTFEIIRIMYSAHKKTGKPDSLRVTYYSNLRGFSEYQCFEHGGFLTRKAQQWWQERTVGDITPVRTSEALDMVSMLRDPTHIKVWLNKEYPEIMDYCFDGTDFGQQEQSINIPIKKIVNSK